jgi:hypothetical protein
MSILELYLLVEDSVSAVGFGSGYLGLPALVRQRSHCEGIETGCLRV